MTKRKAYKTISSLLVILQVIFFSNGSAYMTASNPVSVSTTISGTTKISEDSYWSIENSPYIIDGELIIDEGVNLNISSGVIKLTPGSSIIVNGRINSISDGADNIIFTSVYDDGINLSIDTSQYWNEIRINQTGTFNGIGTTIKHGKKAFTVAGGLNLTSCEISKVVNHGIFVDQSGYFNGTDVIVKDLMTSASSETPIPVYSPSLVPTDTPTNTPTYTPTNTPTYTPTNTSTNTPTNTHISTPKCTHPNLIKNGGFETGCLYSWDNVTCGVKIDPSAAYTGSYGLKLTNSGNIRQVFNTTAGKKYYVYAIIRLDKEIKASTGGGMRVVITDYNWTQLAASQSLNKCNTTIGVWTPVRFTFVAKSKKTRIEYQNFSNGKYIASCDNILVSLYPISAPVPSPNVVFDEKNSRCTSYNQNICHNQCKCFCSRPTSTPTNTPTNTTTVAPTNTPTPSLLPTDTPTNTATNTSTPSLIPTNNVNPTPPVLTQESTALVISHGIMNMSLCTVSDSPDIGILIYEDGMLFSTDLTVKYCEYGIYSKGYISSIMSLVTYCRVGLYSDSSEYSQLTDGSITNNTDFGVINKNETSLIATNNYWNSPSGPSYYDLESSSWVGSGDKVMGLVEFAPWRDSP